MSTLSTVGADAVADPPALQLRMGGLHALVEGVAYQSDPDEKPLIWYLSLVGTREAVRAIWAGLVNSNPVPAILDVPHGDRTVSQLVTLAPRTLSGPWHFHTAALSRAAAYQGVLLPTCAWTDEAPNHADAEAQATASARPFLLLALPSRHAGEPPPDLATLYHARLDRKVAVPLLPHWADWTWDYALHTRSATPLRCLGNLPAAYLCTVDEAALTAAVSAALRTGVLTADPTAPQRYQELAA